MGLNNVSSATVVSEQRCEAKVLGMLSRHPLTRYGRCAFGRGETGLRWVKSPSRDGGGKAAMDTGQ